MASRKGGGLLAKSDFPLYTVRALDDSHFLVAGGGGQAKTGVVNAIEVYQVHLTGDKCIASMVCHHDTGSMAIMNSDNFYDGRNHTLAVGMDDECHIYNLKYKVVSPNKAKESNGDNASIRKRKTSANANVTDKDSDTKYVTFDISSDKSIKTDFGKDSSFQKVVQFGPDLSMLATGGSDGHLRVWKYPDLEKLYEVKAHSTDIDDLTISPCGSKIVTVSRDNHAYVWNTKDGAKHCELKWEVQKSEQYRFRACRYGIVENKSVKFNLYTLNLPVKRASKPSPCYLTMWDTKTYAVKKARSTGTEVLSALAVSGDGTFIGVGMISGSVAVYISFSLQKLHYVHEAHAIFVTGVEFMPSSEAARAVTGGHEFSLLSISADNTIKIHQVPTRGTISMLWIILGFVGALYLIVLLITELGL